jgi:hypothetical protein
MDMDACRSRGTAVDAAVADLAKGWAANGCAETCSNGAGTTGGTPYSLILNIIIDKN